MSELKELLIDQLQDLLHAETQLIGALPKMAEAAHHPKLKEAFQISAYGTARDLARQYLFGPRPNFR